MAVKRWLVVGYTVSVETTTTSDITDIFGRSP